jgi:hypothetical protein
MDVYTHDKIQKLATEIEKLKDIVILTKISTTIQELNSDHHINVNNTGTTLYFDDLSNETYIELEKIILEYKSLNKSINIKRKHKLSDIVDLEEQAKTEELRGMTNHEITMLRRREYDEAINTDTEKLELSDQEFTTLRESDSNKDEKQSKTKKTRKTKTAKKSN